jgi:hypothetical protein
MAISAQQVMDKANEMNIMVSLTKKGSKNAWSITYNSTEVNIIGNKAALDILNMLAATNKNTTPNMSTTIKLRAGVLENPNKTTQAMMLVCDEPNMKISDLIEKANGVSKGTAAVIMSDTRKVLAYLQQKGKLVA